MEDYPEGQSNIEGDEPPVEEKTEPPEGQSTSDEAIEVNETDVEPEGQTQWGPPRDEPAEEPSDGEPLGAEEEDAT
jgi:hypothetical protein